MNKIKEFWNKYNLDRLLGVFWILPFWIEFFIFKYFKIEAELLPFIGVFFFAVSTLRAGSIQKEKKQLPIWYLVAGIPGFITTLCWCKHFALQTVEQAVELEAVASEGLAIIADVGKAFPIVGLILSACCLAFCAGRFLERCNFIYEGPRK